MRLSMCYFWLGHVTKVPFFQITAAAWGPVLLVGGAFVAGACHGPTGNLQRSALRCLGLSEPLGATVQQQSLRWWLPCDSAVTILQAAALPHWCLTSLDGMNSFVLCINQCKLLTSSWCEDRQEIRFRSFFSDYSFSWTNSDHVGACGRFDRPSCPCHGVYDECVPQLPLLFLQQHVHDALENTGTKMSVFFHRQCNFRRSQDMVIIALLNAADLVASLWPSGTGLRPSKLDLYSNGCLYSPVTASIANHLGGFWLPLLGGPLPLILPRWVQLPTQTDTFYGLPLQPDDDDLPKNTWEAAERCVVFHVQHAFW